MFHSVHISLVSTRKPLPDEAFIDIFTHMPRQPKNKKPDKTTNKIRAAIERVMESALRALAEEKALNRRPPKEQKEMIALLMKAVEEMAKITPTAAKNFTPTPTDKALLELYVQQRIARTLPSTL